MGDLSGFRLQPKPIAIPVRAYGIKRPSPLALSRSQPQPLSLVPVLLAANRVKAGQGRDQGTLHPKFAGSFVLPTPLYFATAG